MRLRKNFGRQGFLGQIGAFAAMGRILVRTGVIPRPTVKAALLHRGDIVGRKMRADMDVLISGAISRPCLRLGRHTRTVAKTSTAKLSGTCGNVSAGRSTIIGKFSKPGASGSFFGQAGGWQIGGGNVAPEAGALSSAVPKAASLVSTFCAWAGIINANDSEQW